MVVVYLHSNSCDHLISKYEGKNKISFLFLFKVAFGLKGLQALHYVFAFILFYVKIVYYN